MTIKAFSFSSRGWVATCLAFTTVHCSLATATSTNWCAKLTNVQRSGMFEAHGTRAVDGDTLDVQIDTNDPSTRLRLRMAEIDAPELDQPFGKESKEIFSQAVVGKSLGIRFIDCDRYKRIVASVFIGTHRINDLLVSQGAAWFYPQYSRSAILFELENVARDDHRGLWALPAQDHLEPWIWRRNKHVGRRKP